jgi:hypothetical protein
LPIWVPSLACLVAPVAPTSLEVPGHASQAKIRVESLSARALASSLMEAFIMTDQTGQKSNRRPRKAVHTYAHLHIGVHKCMVVQNLHCTAQSCIVHMIMHNHAFSPIYYLAVAALCCTVLSDCAAQCVTVQHNAQQAAALCSAQCCTVLHNSGA